MTIPKGWASVALSQLGEWQSGSTPSKANPAYWTDGSIPWISPKSMKQQFIDDSNEKITARAVEDGVARIIPKGSVLIVVRSGILKHSVPVAVTKVDCTINQDLRALIPTRGVNPDFVAAQLRWRANELLSVARKQGVTVDSLDHTRLLAFELGLAGFEEQNDVAEKLGDLEAQLAAAHSSLNRTAPLLAVVKSHVNDRLLAGHHSSTSTVQIEDISIERVRTGLSLRGSNDPPGVPAIRLSAMSGPRVDLQDVRYLPVAVEDVEHLILKKGDILIARGSGTRGFVGRASKVEEGDGRTIFPDKAFRVRLNPELVLADWFLAAWNSNPVRNILFQRAKTTAGIWMITRADVLEIKMCIPSAAKQKEDLGLLERTLSQVAKIEHKLQRVERLLSRTKDVLNHRAFSATLVPNVYDPSSASELLDSLMSEKPTRKASRTPRGRRRSTVERFDLLLTDWPAAGLSFEDLRQQLLAPYEELKEAAFAKLASGELVQKFDPGSARMLLQRPSRQ